MAIPTFHFTKNTQVVITKVETKKHSTEEVK